MNPVLFQLLAAAKDSPEDDGPRLVLADWLEEHDDPRGEFVRLQVLLEKLDPDDPAACRRSGGTTSCGSGTVRPGWVRWPSVPRCAGDRGLVDLR